MILKLLLVIAVIAIVYTMFIKPKPEVTKKEKKSDTDPKNPQANNDMIKCAECGVYCTIDEMILGGGKYYCSKECLEKN